MMMWRTRLAGALVRHAAAVMPRKRSEWARAMEAEFAHLAVRDRLAFALGCVSGSYRERLSDPATLLAAGRGTITLGLCAFAILCLRTATMLEAADPAKLVLALGLSCLVAAATVVGSGLRSLPLVAIAGFAAATLAIVTIAGTDSLVGDAMPTGRFYRAILLEQIAGWAALFGFAHILLTLENRHGAHD